jgi:transposase
MDRAQLNTITDVQTLRQMVAEQRQVIAERDMHIAQQVAVITRHHHAIIQHECTIIQHECTITQQERTITQHERTITEREARISVLTAEIARLRRAQFAARSEKMDPAQRALFEETMAADIAAVEAELEALQSPPVTPEAASRPRQAPKRRPLPEDLERIETRHEPASCRCGQCGGDLVPIVIMSARSCRAARCSSLCVVTSIRSTPAVAARRSLRCRWHRP